VEDQNRNGAVAEIVPMRLELSGLADRPVLGVDEDNLLVHVIHGTSQSRGSARRRPSARRAAISSSVKLRSARLATPRAPITCSPLKIGTTIAPERLVARAPGRTSPLSSVWILQASTGAARSTARPA